MRKVKRVRVTKETDIELTAKEVLLAVTEFFGIEFEEGDIIQLSTHDDDSCFDYALRQSVAGPSCDDPENIVLQIRAISTIEGRDYDSFREEILEG